jgi:PEP-CTERM motif
MPWLQTLSQAWRGLPIVRSGTLQASDFNALSVGGSPSWPAAIHVQNTGTNGQSSGWMGAGPSSVVPEPSSFVLLGFAGLIALSYRRLRGLHKLPQND